MPYPNIDDVHIFNKDLTFFEWDSIISNNKKYTLDGNVDHFSDLKFESCILRFGVYTDLENSLRTIQNVYKEFFKRFNIILINCIFIAVDDRNGNEKVFTLKEIIKE